MRPAPGRPRATLGPVGAGGGRATGRPACTRVEPRGERAAGAVTLLVAVSAHSFLTIDSGGASAGVGLTALREKYGAQLEAGDRRMLEQMERDVDEVLQILRSTR